MLSFNDTTWIVDIESTGLINDSTVDYSASPFRLKSDYKTHCVVFRNVMTDELFIVEQPQGHELKTWIAKNVTKIVAHHGIGFDFMVLLAAYGIEYTLGYSPASLKSTWNGKDVDIIDTYILSKVLNPDRRGHSLKYFGEKLSDKEENQKIDWRQRAIELGLIEKDAPKGAEFIQYHPEMLEYCIQDTKVNKLTLLALKEEWESWEAKGNSWDMAYETEQYTAWIEARQQHRGFWFDREGAITCIKDLDEKLEYRASVVEPLLPEKPMSMSKIKEFTPPKIQVVKNGGLSSHMKKFIERNNGTAIDTEEGWLITINNKQYSIPMIEPVKTTEPATIKDSTFIKGFLVSLGWNPTQWKERDLTCDTKKNRLSPEKFVAAVDRYVKQTLDSPFCDYRLAKVKATRESLRRKLLTHDISRPLKVLTNPTFTVGQDKEIDPALDGLKDVFPSVQEIVEYLTYAHRRNSILGGGYDPDEEEDEGDEWTTGYLPNLRSDGRIPTPADTCGCNTSRFKHRVVANIPRSTSLYGEEMRALFGVDTSSNIQFGYDFCSLEAVMESHYCYPFEESVLKEYCNSLVQEKPNDVHTLMSKKIEEIIGSSFSRSNAKSVKYACLPMNTKVLTKDGWKLYEDIKEGDVLPTYNLKTRMIEDDVVKMRHFFTDKHVCEWANKESSFNCTPDHRWVTTNNKFKFTYDLWDYDELLLNSEWKSEAEKYYLDTEMDKPSTFSCENVKITWKGVQDTFCLTTGNGTFIIWQDDFIGITGNCTYGAQEGKVAATIGCDKTTGSIVYNAFWEAAKPLALLLENVINFWEGEGNRSYLIGIDGRRLNTRAKHSILNTLFQSAGVICAKTTMVWQDIMLRREGLGVCFWSEDWKNKKYVQQLIAYHK